MKLYVGHVEKVPSSFQTASRHVENRMDCWRSTHSRRDKVLVRSAIFSQNIVTFTHLLLAVVNVKPTWGCAFSLWAALWLSEGVACLRLRRYASLFISAFASCDLDAYNHCVKMEDGHIYERQQYGQLQSYAADSTCGHVLTGQRYIRGPSVPVHQWSVSGQI